MVTFTWLEQTPLWRFNAFLCGISTGVLFYWVIIVLSNGIQFTTESFDIHGYYIYWLASESINLMNSVEIFYPERDVKDTVKIYRIESQ